MNGAKGKLWTKDFIVISLSTFFLTLVFYLYITSVTVYVQDHFRAPESLAGLASSIFTLGGVVARVFAGKYMELIGRKKMLYAGLICFVLATLLYFPDQHLYVFVLLRFLHGAAFGAAHAVLSTAVVDVMPRERRGEGVGYYFLSFTLATAIGPFVAIFILQRWDFPMLFLFNFLLSILCFLVALFAVIPKAVITKEQLEEIKRLSWDNFIEKRALPISTTTIILGFSYAGVLSFVTPYAMGLGLTAAVSFFCRKCGNHDRFQTFRRQAV